MSQTPPRPDAVSAVDEAIRTRHSIRRFLPTPVAREVVEELLALAACAPSGTNVQPWKVYALAGDEKTRLSSAIIDKFNSTGMDGREFDYYPKQWVEPWLGRRRKVGFALYGLLGIGKEDKAAMKQQTARNYLFFDAPVGLILTIDRRLGQGMFIDYGMFMANLMIAARARGLDTCAQAAFADYHVTIREVLDIPDDEVVVCGMALGYADADAIENTLRSEREPVAGFSSLRGFP
ncbi:nitroreductase [Rhodocyclus tenuis]|uniref:Nitroreductase n=1 Tax=Rhodocyclus gracilis TaxID=2929842 RepID=A0ABX0WJ82_9RHOO|nr:nitroreductase [Rhodocyclus gracilis]NJA88958.1 nitroreductase [Rhodocyclus gracilis]